MARVLFTSARQDGFVLPLLQLVRAMVARGDEVWFLCGDAYRDRIEAAGAVFERMPYDEAVPPSRIEHEQPRSGVREVARLLRSLFLDSVEPDFRTVMALHGRIGFDLVVTEPLFVGAAAVGLLPRSERPAVLSIGLFPLPFSSPDVPPFGSGLTPIEGPLNPLRNALLRGAADVVALERVRKEFAATIERLTGRRPSGGLFDLGLTSDAWAQTSVPQFEYPRRRTPEQVRWVGPLPAPTSFPLPDWWDYSERRRIVHVTQGTYANEDPTELIVPTIRALAEEDVLVVATTGGPDRSTIERAHGGPLPANVRVERFMPYDHLLPAAAVMVTNGGFGAVHHALRHGLPLVVAGTSEDKVEVNARVRWAGVGIDLHQQRVEPDAVREAVLHVLDERARFRRAAARLARAIADTDAIASVLEIADELTTEVPARP
ncbi:nucleotide disphospho-sugar-binding domain-containing protein [Amnibacterium kyonggiense]|uniref:nucleotide disphospho-sugar-binding domain-containing protein n=1 Tax=Amnibacterium kyonggiense TaxID=595671 RepID=UPI00105D13AB|nr:nucleotide disphospho-sugar-binding domain-containing protein [Amnibacterium kyonggiense]